MDVSEAERWFRDWLAKRRAAKPSSIVLGIREAFLSLHCAGARTCNTFLLLP